MILGSPAKAVRTLTAEQLASLRASADHYVANSKRFKATLNKLA